MARKPRSNDWLRKKALNQYFFPYKNQNNEHFSATEPNNENLTRGLKSKSNARADQNLRFSF